MGLRAGFQSGKFPVEEMFKANVKHEGFTATQGCLLCEKATQLPFPRGNATSEVAESHCLNLTFLCHRVSCSPGWSQIYCVAEAGLELQSLLLLLSMCWNYSVCVTMSSLFLFLLAGFFVYTKPSM